MIINSLYIDLLKSVSHIKNNENMISRNSNRNNKEESKLKLSELYWLYMQTCPFFVEVHPLEKLYFLLYYKNTLILILDYLQKHMIKN